MSVSFPTKAVHGMRRDRIADVLYVDVALFSHVSGNLSTSWGPGGGSGLVSVLYSFEGSAAHAAGAPWRGRSALDAVELMNVGWNYRREHLPLEHRSHYVITNGGDQPNVVPRNASVWYYFRQTTYPKIKELWGIGESIAKGAAEEVGVLGRDVQLLRGLLEVRGLEVLPGEVEMQPAGLDTRVLQRDLVADVVGVLLEGARESGHGQVPVRLARFALALPVGPPRGAARLEDEGQHHDGPGRPALATQS